MHIEISNGTITRALPSARARVVIDGAEMLIPHGAVVLPGFVDAHCHLMGLGQMSERVQLGGVHTSADCLSRVALRAFSTPPGEWILGFGWNETEWLDRAVPSRDALDAACPDNPAALYRIDTHAVWLNSRAIDAAGITARDIEGGEVVVDERGEPTGLLIDNAVSLIDAVLPAPGAGQMRRWIATAVDRCLSYGITEVHDMNVSLDAVSAADALAAQDGLRLRSNVFLEGMNDGWRSFGDPRRLATMLDVVGVKYFTDGALGSRGAWLIEPYSDDPTLGLKLIDEDELAQRALEAAGRGYAIATHAIGDAAARLTLDAYARVRHEQPDAILRMEHAQNVQPVDVPRFAALDVVASVQPTHCTSDAPMAELRLGQARCANAYRWRSLLDAGVGIIAGSDFPIESPDPLAGLRAFVKRTPPRRTAPWLVNEAIDLSEAIDAFTRSAPIGLPRSIRRGELREGWDADVVVLTGDPLSEDTTVLYTIVAGRLVYEGV